MKYFLALLLCIVQVKFCLFHNAVDEDSGAALQKRVVTKDLLSDVSCHYIKKNGYCTHSFIQNKLCYVTCHCDDILSQKSCSIIKAKKNCSISWSAYFCKFTCERCTTGHNLTCTTSNPLGMKSGAIPDSSLTASSEYSSNHSPARARLDARAQGGKSGAWSAKVNNLNQWLQVDLGRKTKVTHIATQGRQDSDERVKSYSVQYNLDGQRFFDYQGGKTFSGNSDRNTIVKHAFTPPITARYIRVRPKTWQYWISMRMELYGCR